MTLHRLAIAAAALALAGVSVAAQAVIVNIDATTATPTTTTFAAGTYEIAFIGKAQGGQYDGWTYNSSASQYREAFTADFGSQSYTVDHYSGSASGYYQGFATASEALQVFSGNQYAIMSNGTFLFATGLLEWTFATPTSVSFSVPDDKFDDNSGGVSLSITSGGAAALSTASAVPEPETYALMLAGLGAVGFLIRRRRPV